MLTGGFERRDQAAEAVSTGATDMAGLARALVFSPGLANTWLTNDGGNPDFPVFDAPPRGGVTAWYSTRLTALGDDAEHSFTLTPADALRIYEERDAERCVRWLKAFPDV